MDHAELLRRYVEEHSDEAFTALVRANLDLVYSAALRQSAGDVRRAQEVSQTVFTELARNAASLVRHSSLTGWLYTTAHFTAAKLRRTEQVAQRLALHDGAFHGGETPPHRTAPPSARNAGPSHERTACVLPVRRELGATASADRRGDA
jgi:DNA-directed RNA polymerase specialized sigma24 family protein